MKKINSNTKLDDLLDGAVSANECTGALQRISLDVDEIARFHDEYVGDRHDRK